MEMHVREPKFLLPLWSSFPAPIGRQIREPSPRRSLWPPLSGIFWDPGYQYRNPRLDVGKKYLHEEHVDAMPGRKEHRCRLRLVVYNGDWRQRLAAMEAVSCDELAHCHNVEYILTYTFTGSCVVAGARCSHRVPAVRNRTRHSASIGGPRGSYLQRL